MSTANTDYHRPVLPDAGLDLLRIDPAGTYVDATFGGGGHARRLLSRLTGGRLFAFDQDADAARRSADDVFRAGNFTFIEGNFRHLRRYLRLYGVRTVDGILADIGVSSHQFDTAGRGFSTRFDGDLDMRMDQTAPRTAAQVLDTYPERELHRVLGQYGEVRNARTLAAALVRRRIEAPLRTTAELRELLRTYAPRGKEHKYFAQVFQALRIEVNDELGALRDLLTESEEVLKPGGRLVVISYHSLEDRLVKRYLQRGLFEGEPERDLYGRTTTPFTAITRKPVLPTDEEVAANPRARSAKLRAGERNPT
ncbi:MAG: 16S rRNA (cytosine(1402)-N(4))-methyltransferase RsmH [Catalinimonas sp.]